MRYHGIGTQPDMEASVIALGTWAIGGWKWGGSDETESIHAIQAALDNGINFIDTAPVYGMGRAEEIVGKAIRERRENLIIATKCGLRWEGLPEGMGVYFFTDEQGCKIFRCNHPESIRHEIEQSLRRLRVETIDLYQTHWQDPTCPIEEVMGTLMDLKTEGKIRAIGTCNATLKELREYRRAGPLDSDQELFSMLDQGIRGHHLTFTREQGMAVLSYSTLALGLLTGKITPDRKFHGDDFRRDSPRFTRENLEMVHNLLQRMQPIADHYGMSLTQLALAWTSLVPGITHVLCGARNPGQARENARAGEFTLDPSHFREIDQIIREANLKLPPAAVRKKSE